jgi:hypothetical protein
MSINPLGAIFDLGKFLIQKKWPNPAEQAAEMLKLEALRQKGDIAELTAHVTLISAQLKINEIEATHKSLFVAGWRPATGWACLAGLLYPFFTSLLSWGLQLASWVFGADVSGFPMPPKVEAENLVFILIGMLGLGKMRSDDKKNGVQTDNIGGR